MRTLSLSLLAVLGMAFPGCTSEAASTPNAAVATATETFGKIKDLLAGVTSVDAAKTAKEKLAPMLEKASSAMASLKSLAGGDGTKGLADAAKDMAKKATEVFTPKLKETLGGVTKEIERISANADLKSVFGDLLGKLTEMVKV